MATFKSCEQILDDLESKLQSDLSSALDQVDTEHTGTKLNLPVPSEGNYYIANNVNTVPEISNMPAVALMAWNEVITMAGEQSWDRWDVDVAARLWNSGWDQEKLTRSVYRYAEAIVRIVRTEFLALVGICAISDIRVDYSSVSPTEPLFQACEISFKVRVERNYAYG